MSRRAQTRYSIESQLFFFLKGAQVYSGSEYSSARVTWIEERSPNVTYWTVMEGVFIHCVTTFKKLSPVALSVPVFAAVLAPKSATS